MRPQAQLRRQSMGLPLSPPMELRALWGSVVSGCQGHFLEGKRLNALERVADAMAGACAAAAAAAGPAAELSRAELAEAEVAALRGREAELLAQVAALQAAAEHK